MKMLAAANSNLLLGVLSFAILAFSLMVSDGYFSVDEFVYFLSAETFARDLSWVIVNGPERFVSDDLVFFNLVSGPNGVVSQYPVGSTLLASPLVYLFGIRGMILLNAVSAIGTILLTRSLARSFFRDNTIALASVLILVFCTFFIEFAFGIWPHALSTFLVLASIRLFLWALDEEPRNSTGLAVAAGLVLGLGFLVRTDAMLILPAFGAVAVLYAPRPIRFAVAGGVGLLPAFALAAWANWSKFGTPNPLSYGAAPGGISLGQHQVLIYLSIAVLALLFLARQVEWRSSWSKPAVVAGVAILALLWFLIPQAQSLLGRYGFGAYNLLADLRPTPDQRPGILSRGDGTVEFWQLPKKALGQSLPWLPILLLVYLRPWEGMRRRDLVFCLIALAFWTLPFLMLAWHGGLSSNMRYFHSVLPLIAILGAGALVNLVQQAGSASRPLAIGYVLGVLAVIGWTILGPAGLFGAHQMLSTYLLVALITVAVLVSAKRRLTPGLAKYAAGAFAVGLGASTVLGPVHDLALAQSHRAENRQTNAELSQFQAPSLFIGPPEDYAFQMGRPEGLLAHPAIGSPVDMNLIEDALDEGFDVYVSIRLLPDVLRQSARFEAKGTPLTSDEKPIVYRIGRVGDQGQDS